MMDGDETNGETGEKVEQRRRPSLSCYQAWAARVATSGTRNGSKALTTSRREERSHWAGRDYVVGRQLLRGYRGVSDVDMTGHEAAGA